MDSKSETEHNEYQETANNKFKGQLAFNKLLGISGKTIESPRAAKSYIKLDRFWSETVPKDVIIPQNRELLLGFDYDTSKRKLICTETTLGEVDSNKPKERHLIMLHTEPAQNPEPFRSNTAKFADSLPDAYLGDLHFIMKDSSIYSEIIIRLGSNNNPAAFLVVMKTKQSRDISRELRKYQLSFKDIFLDSSNPVKQRLRKDSIVTKEGGFAVYRGFSQIPPTENDIFRLRKFD